MSTTPLSRIPSTPHLDSTYPAAPLSYSKKLAGLNDGPRDLNQDGGIDELEQWAHEFTRWLFENKSSLHELSAQEWAQMDAYIQHVQQTTGAYDWDPRVQLGITPGGSGGFSPPTGEMGPGFTGTQGTYILNEPQNTLNIDNQTPEGIYEVWGDLELNLEQISHEATFEETELEEPSEPSGNILKIIVKDRATGKEWIILHHEQEDWETKINAANPDAVSAVGDSLPPGVEVGGFEPESTSPETENPALRETTIPREETSDHHYRYVVPYGERAGFTSRANGMDSEDTPITEYHEFFGDIAVYGQPDQEIDIQYGIENEDGTIEEGVTITITNLSDGSQDVLHVRNGTGKIYTRANLVRYEDGATGEDIPESLEDYVSFEGEASTGTSRLVNPNAEDLQPTRTERNEDGSTTHFYDEANDGAVHLSYDDEAIRHEFNAGGTIEFYPSDNRDQMHIEKLGPEEYQITFTNADGQQVTALLHGVREFIWHGLESNVSGDIDSTFRIGGAPFDEGNVRITRDQLNYDTNAILDYLRTIKDGQGRDEAIRLFNAIDTAFRTGDWESVSTVIANIPEKKFNNGIRALVVTLDFWDAFGEFMGAIPGEIRQEMIDKAGARTGQIDQKFDARGGDSWQKRYEGFETYQAIAMISATLDEADFENNAIRLGGTDDGTPSDTGFEEENSEPLEDPEEY